MSSDNKWTDPQKQAIYNDGNILVAAAAGSGKTAVLVEHVINKLCSKTNPVSADRLLIVTFTNAAAAEMRGRIQKRLDDECRKNPDAALMKQKHLLSSAKICTIDSFCIDFVRENFEKAGVSPDFIIGEEQMLEEINNRVISEIVDRYIIAEDKVFSLLLDIVGSEFDEENAKQLVLKLYKFSRQLPFPKKWYEKIAKNFDFSDFENNIWVKYAFKDTLFKVCEYKKSIANAIDLSAVNQKTAEKYLPFFSDLANILSEIENACRENDWDKCFEIVNGASAISLPMVKGVSDIPEISAAKLMYKEVSDYLKEDIVKYFYADKAFIIAQSEKIYPALALLSDVLKEFDEKVFEAYKEENVFTFHNTEHLALSVLCEEKDGKVSVRKGFEEFIDRYDEVCVDEYQDTNDLQNMLFKVLSDNERKLFVVGDVKQSIYRFRGANPEGFTEKKEKYIPFDIAGKDDAKKIILSNNFRTRSQVCDFINYFFTLFMNRDTGRIIYNEEEKLTASAEYPSIDRIAVSMDIIGNKGNELSNKIAEAAGIADYIKKMMKAGPVVKGSDGNLRNAVYSDFVILLRSVKNYGNVLVSQLRKQGIPINNAAEGFAQYTEISTVLSLLSVIDNPCRDVELLAVMLSPVFGFTEDEVAVLRSENKKGNFYSILVNAKNNGNLKVCSFFDKLEKYRLYAVTDTLPGLIERLIYETGFSDTVLSMPDGGRRRNNLLLLIEYASQYCQSGKNSIGGFVDHIVKQSENGIHSAVSLSGENAVRIMSIHSSKGLQFPICIIAGTASRFNDSDSRENIIYSTDLGLGIKYYDEEDKTKYTTLAREVMLKNGKSEELEEELRLLYVAMTRTQDILHITAVTSDPYDKISQAVSKLMLSQGEISATVFGMCNSYFDWLLMASLLHPDGKKLTDPSVAIIRKETDSRVSVDIKETVDICEEKTAEVNENAQPDEKVYCAVKRNLSFVYPYEELTKVSGKASASVLANAAESEKYIFSALPDFMSNGGISPSGRGTAVHKVMQFFDFSMHTDVKSEIERLAEWQYITENEAKAVKTEAIEKFFESHIFKRILNADNVKREMRFLTEIPAQKIYPELSIENENETVMIQGAVDVCFTEPDGVVVVDFKTDRTDDPQSLRKAYGEQLNIYAAACEKLFGMRVKQKIIYSFSLDKEIEI